MVIKELSSIRENLTAGVGGDVGKLVKAGDDLLKLGLRTFSSNIPVITERTRVVGGIVQDFGFSWFTTSGTNTLNRGEVLMRDVTPLPFTISYRSGAVDRDDPYLHAWNTVEDSTDADIKLRLSKELGWLGSSMSPTIYTFCAAACFDFENNPLIQNMKFYFNTFPASEEPIRTMGDGTSFVTPYDTMSHKRWLVLLTGAIAYDHAIRQGTGIGPVILEQTRYIFQDPDWHTKTLKSMTGLHIQSSFALTPGGYMTKWDNIDLQALRVGLAGFRVVEFGPGNNDEISYAMLKKDLDANLAEMIEAGLHLTARFWSQNLTARFEVVNIRAAQNVQSLLGMAAFTRTDANVSFQQQNAKAPEMPPLPPSGYYPIEPHIDAKWTQLIRQAHDLGLLQSEKDFKASLVRVLTSKSAGGGLSSKVKFSVHLKTAFPGLRILSERGTVLEISLADKRSVFYFDPESQLTKRMMHLAVDAENPGASGARQVTQGKATRFIAVRRLAGILAEWWLIPAMTRIMTSTIDYHGEKAPFGTINDYTETNTTGRTLFDQSHLFYASSDPNLLVSNADFSAFDSTQREQVSRPVSTAVSRELTALGYTSKFLDFEGGQAEMVSEVYASAFKSVHKLPPSPLSEAETMDLTGLPSGMLATKVINDITNYAAYVVFNGELQKAGLNASAEVMTIKIQGDDFLAVYRITRDNHSEHVWTKDKAMAFVALRVKVAADNGMEINGPKTSLRIWGGEYLKIYVRYGCQLFLNVISHYAQERAARARDPRDEALGWNSKITTKLARGDNMYFWKRMIVMRWAYARSVRSFTDLGVLHVAPPMATLFTPISMNGLGRLPWLPFGSNHDSSIRIHSRYDAQFEMYVNCAATVMGFSASRITDQVATQIATGDGLDPPDLFDKGHKFIKETMSSLRTKNASRAQAFLTSYGVPVPAGLYYINLAETTIAEAVKSNPKMVGLAEANKVSATRAMILRAKHGWDKGPDKFISSKHPLIDAFDWELGELMEPVLTGMITPFPGHDDLADSIVRMFGVSSGADEFAVNPGEIVQRIASATPMRASATLIFNFITKPIFLIHDDLLYNAMLAFGIEAGEALSLAEAVKKNHSFFGLREAAAGFSLASPLMTSLDKSRSAHNRVVVVEALANDVVSNIVSEIGMLFCISNFALTGEARRIYARRRPNTDVQIQRVVQGRLFNEGDHPWTMLSNRDVDNLISD
jgi:hypothetical protein